MKITVIATGNMGSASPDNCLLQAIPFASRVGIWKSQNVAEPIANVSACAAADALGDSERARQTAVWLNR